ncbi:MAG: class I adenylate-forming enzyme family protein [Acidimicrobiia bacterium]
MSDTTPRVLNPYITAGTLWSLLAKRAALNPDKMLFCDERDRSFTYAQFTAWCERVAAGLHGQGIGNLSRVSWQLPTRIETIVFSMALSRLGVVQNPIIHLYRGHEVGSLLDVTNAEVFAVQGVWKNFDYAAMANELTAKLNHDCRVMVLDDGLPDGDPSTLPPIPTDGDTIRWIYATSGTTSVPKAVLHTDGTLMAGGEGLARAYNPAPDEIVCIFFPYAHIGGPDQLVIMLEYGLSAILMEAFLPADAVALMNKWGATQSGGSTAFYQAFVAEQLKSPGAKIVPTLRALCGGGAPKPPEVFWQVREVLDVDVYHGFGMTECPSMASNGSGDSDEQMANTDGAPVVGCEIEIRDDDRRPLPANTVGEIWVRGPMVCKGYLDPAATAAAFDETGFFHTGDRGLLRDDGRIVLTGRSKDMIIRKGENISPREIEDVLITHPKVAAVAVIGIRDVDRGERVCAVVELAAGADPITLDEVTEVCTAGGLMRQKHPEQLEIVAALPRNPTMKILKTELRKMFDPTQQ